MISFSFDGNRVEVAEGTTLLEAARSFGIDIPTLCHRRDLCIPKTVGNSSLGNPTAQRGGGMVEGEASYPPRFGSNAASCLVCVMKVGNRIVPSCVTLAENGMIVESETSEIHAMRRGALELLLSEHRGDCDAPCQVACPAQGNLPEMLRHFARGEKEQAWRIIRVTIPFPSILGSVCPAPCEKICRRRKIDSAIPICAIKKEVGLFGIEQNLRDDDIPKPVESSLRDKHVVIVGGGLSGMTAAYFLTRQSISVTLYEAREVLGGRLHDIAAEQLPHTILEKEIASLAAPNLEVRLSRALAPSDLAKINADAIFIATGISSFDFADEKENPKANSSSKIFRPKSPRRANTLAIRSVADGRIAADEIMSFLQTSRATTLRKTWNLRERGDSIWHAEEIPQRVTKNNCATKNNDEGDTSETKLKAEAAMCLHCDCRGRTSCQLRHYAAIYEANPYCYETQIEKSHREKSKLAPRVLKFINGAQLDQAKCIKCGLCIQVAAESGESLGLTFVGRGFEMEVDIPFAAPAKESLSAETVKKCVAVCPTGALK